MGLIVKDAESREHLIDLIIVGEGHRKWTEDTVFSVRLNGADVRASSQHIDDALDQGQLHRAVVVGSRTGSVPVAKILAVLVLEYFFGCEHCTEGAFTSRDLAFKSTQVWEDAQIRCVELEISTNKGAEALNDRRKVDRVPNLSLSRARLVIISRT